MPERDLRSCAARARRLDDVCERIERRPRASRASASRRRAAGRRRGGPALPQRDLRSYAARARRLDDVRERTNDGRGRRGSIGWYNVSRVLQLPIHILNFGARGVVYLLAGGGGEGARRDQFAGMATALSSFFAIT